MIDTIPEDYFDFLRSWVRDCEFHNTVHWNALLQRSETWGTTLLDFGLSYVRFLNMASRQRYGELAHLHPFVILDEDWLWVMACECYEAEPDLDRLEIAIQLAVSDSDHMICEPEVSEEEERRIEELVKRALDRCFE